MDKRCPRNYELLGIAELNGYDFFINTRGVASIAVDTVNPENKVHGLLFEISENCLACLDKYEEYPNVYQRYLMTVDFQGNELESHVYIDPKTTETGTPRGNYLERIIATANQFNFSSEYITHLETFLPNHRS